VLQQLDMLDEFGAAFAAEDVQYAGARITHLTPTRHSQSHISHC
jgi:hypothetical protein